MESITLSPIGEIFSDTSFPSALFGGETTYLYKAFEVIDTDHSDKKCSDTIQESKNSVERL